MPPVIVALDGSSRAETVLPHARVVAVGGRLTLMTTMWHRDGVRSQEYLERRASAMTPMTSRSS